MPNFVYDKNSVQVYANESIKISSNLEPHVYNIKQNPKTMEFFLEKGENFTPFKKIYGNCNELKTKIINTFISREKSTGIILNGNKGSGKTLLAKEICIECNRIGYPVILVNDNYEDPNGLNIFIQSIGVPCVILMDEFEKVFDEESQEYILSILDGVYSHKTLFILTSNDVSKINVNLINRPGRIFYYISYEGIDENTIKQYCNENLNNKNEINSIIKLHNIIQNMNFDQLVSIVEEMNRYNQSLLETIKYMNIKVEESDTYEISAYKGDNPNNKVFVYPSITNCPLLFNRFFSIQEGEQEHHIYLNSDQITEFDNINKTYKLKKDGFTFIVNKMKNVSFNISNHL